MPAALSPVATTAQAGLCFHAGGPEGSENASSATGRWTAAISPACSSETSPAKASRTLAGSIANSVADLPSAVGYCRGTSALLRTLSFDDASTAPRTSPSSGANAAT